MYVDRGEELKDMKDKLITNNKKDSKYEFPEDSAVTFFLLKVSLPVYRRRRCSRAFADGHKRL